MIMKIMKCIDVQMKLIDDNWIFIGSHVFFIWIPCQNPTKKKKETLKGAIDEMESDSA